MDAHGRTALSCCSKPAAIALPAIILPLTGMVFRLAGKLGGGVLTRPLYFPIHAHVALSPLHGSHLLFIGLLWRCDAQTRHAFIHLHVWALLLKGKTHVETFHRKTPAKSARCT